MALNQRIVLACDRCHAVSNDHCVVNFLHLKWMQNYKNTRDHQHQPILACFKQAMNQIAIMVVAIDGQVQFISQRTEHLFSQYSLPYSGQTLPDPLYQWFQQQIAQLAANGDDLSFSSPLHIEQAEQQLTIRLISGSAQEHYFLLMEERMLPSLSISALELIGLTKREAEALFWVAKDKSNAEIAKLLNCQEGTVRKHLENMRQKLGVQTRTAAVMVALERTALLRV